MLPIAGVTDGDQVTTAQQNRPAHALCCRRSCVWFVFFYDVRNVVFQENYADLEGLALSPSTTASQFIPGSMTCSNLKMGRGHRKPVNLTWWISRNLSVSDFQYVNFQNLVIWQNLLKKKKRLNLPTSGFSLLRAQYTWSIIKTV